MVYLRDRPVCRTTRMRDATGSAGAGWTRRSPQEAVRGLTWQSMASRLESTVTDGELDRRPAILYVLDEYPTLSQTFVSTEINELRCAGWSVDVVALRVGAGTGDPALTLDRPSLRDSIVTLLWWLSHHPWRVALLARQLARLRFQYARYALLRVPKMARFLASNKPVRCHCHFFWGASAVASYISTLLGVPLSVTGHARDLYIDSGNLRGKLRSVDLLITVCDFNVRSLERRGYSLPETHVIRCGTRVPTAAPGPVEYDVVSVARLVPKKGIDLLVRAVALLRRRISHVRVCIVGDGEDRGLLEQLIRELDLAANVTLVGALPHEEALDVIGRGRVFALPCRIAPDGDNDAFPVVLWEAMARGVPVVTTPVGGIPEVVTDQNGWLVEPDNPVSLAAALEEALLDEGRWTARAEQAQACAEEHGSIAKQIALLASLFASRINAS